MTISTIHPDDLRFQRKFDALLSREGIRRDPHLEHIIGVFDDDYNLLAAGGTFANTLRCLVVDSAYRGEGLLEQVVTALVDYQQTQGRTHLFVYTKYANVHIFTSLGFYEVASVAGETILMENRRDGFAKFISALGVPQVGTTSALIMNCNPFTLGHRYLVETAASENDIVHLFVVSEDLSHFPFKDRYELVRLGCAHLPNVQLHKTESYMISAAVFPSYFLKDEASVVATQAALDAAIFLKIASALGIKRRYLGEEPFSATTNQYNAMLRATLPAGGVECVIVPRLAEDGLAISASRVRILLQDGQLEHVRKLVPETTFEYLMRNIEQ